MVLASGLFLGWLLFGESSSQPATTDEHHHHADEKQVWTCSMHPHIKQDKPGQCPICGMDLIPLKTAGHSNEAIDPNAIQLSDEAVALANIQTTVIGKQHPVKDIQLYGTIQADERLKQSLTSHVNGRIERLYINFTGEAVKRGQTIATVYSPDLMNAQQELIEAARMQQPALLQAAREKLHLWKLSDEQIARIEQSGTVSPLVDITATGSGIVVNRNVSQGDYVNQGSVLFELANLSQVWALFDAYESDLPFLKVGDRTNFTLQALPGKTFSGRISFIDPIVDKTTRTVKVRVETANPGLQLKPEMYANALIKAPLSQQSNQLVVPKSAVLWTGKRSIVYLKQPNAELPTFMLREIELGPSLGDAYVVQGGLNPGDEVVTNGAFTIDASAQLEGKHSMMNSEGTSVSANLQHAQMAVDGLCDMCKARIEKAVKDIDGVSAANWELASKQLHVSFDPAKTNSEAIARAVAKAGHDTDKYKATQAAYDNLPSCCKYREND